MPRWSDRAGDDGGAALRSVCNDEAGDGRGRTGMSEETGPRVVASYCPEPACRRVGSVHFVNSACKEVFPGWPWDLSQCPGVLQAAVSMADYDAMVERLRKETR